MLIVIAVVVILVVLLVMSKSTTTTKDIEESRKYQELTDWQKAQLMRSQPRVTLTLPCPRCGHVLLQGMRFCPECGQKADWSVYNKSTTPKAEDEGGHREEKR